MNSEDYETVIIGGNTRNNSSNINLLRAYCQPLKIPLDKYKDLISMCKSNVIPVEYHPFFENLAHTLSSEANNETDDASYSETESFFL